MALNSGLVLGTLATKSGNGVGTGPDIHKTVHKKETAKDLLEVGSNGMFRRRVHVLHTRAFSRPGDLASLASNLGAKSIEATIKDRRRCREILRVRDRGGAVDIMIWFSCCGLGSGASWPTFGAFSAIDTVDIPLSACTANILPGAANFSRATEATTSSHRGLLRGSRQGTSQGHFGRV